MATWNSLPGTLNLNLVKGDDFATTIDFSIDMTGYAISASIYSLVSGNIVETFTTSFVSAADGTVNVALTESQTASLGHATYGWKFVWVAPGSITRTALSGMLEVV